MALGMFVAIPLPFHIWDEKLTTIMVACFPLVGLLIGALWWGGLVLLTLPTFPVIIVAAILTVLPFWLAGFIHLDGYMDTSDAILSWRPLEDRLRILKDSLVGAFAVIMVVILFLLQFAAVFSIVDGGRFFALLIVICVLSRSLSVFCIFTLRHNEISHYVALIGDKKSSASIVFTAFVALAAFSFAVFYAGLTGVIVCLAVVVGYAFAMRKACKSMDGISGDLLGYAMVIGELCGLIGLALTQGMELTVWF